MSLDTTSYLLGKKAGGSGGTTDYSQLTNKPSINGVTLSGDKSTEDLGIEANVPQITIDTQKILLQDTLDEVSEFISNNIGNVVCVNVVDGTIYQSTGYIQIENTINNYTPSTNEMTTFGISLNTVTIQGSWSSNTYTASTIVVASLNTKKALAVDNTTVFTPSGDYQPATKKYVDDNAGGSLPIASASTLGGIKVGEGLNVDASTGILSTGFIKVVEVDFPNSTRYFSSKVIKELSGRGLYLIKNMNQTAGTGSTKMGSVLLWCDPIRYYQVRQTFMWGSTGSLTMYSREIDPRNVDDTTAIYGDSLSLPVFYPSTSTRPVASSDIHQRNNATVEDITRWYGNNKSILDLTTTNKTSLVDAINEVNGKIGNINTVLATLTTPSSNVSL